MTALVIASDHGGFKLKGVLANALQDWGIEFEDLGTDSDASCDYPDFAHAVAKGLESGRWKQALLVCGTGVGMSIAANRHPSVRAAAVSDPYSAFMAREHNHANVLCLGERVVGEGLAKLILRTWLDAEESSDPRHVRRVSKLNPPQEPR